MNEKDIKPEQTIASQSKSTQSAAVQVSPIEQQQTDRNVSYDISDEKLLTAAAQLVDVYNKRSKASATITLQKKPNVEQRNSKQSTRPAFGVPNFIVTKITEKTPDKGYIGRDKNTSPAVNINKTFHKPDEIDQTKRIVEAQRQKSLQLFNAAQNEEQKQARIVFDTKDFKVKSLSVSNKHGETDEFSKRIRPTTLKSKSLGAAEMNKKKLNEPVILNFRSKMHDATAQPRQNETTIKNGRKKINTYRVLEISPLSKVSGQQTMASQVKSAERYYANKLYSSSIGKSVRPVSMPVTKVYSRFPPNSNRAPHRNRMQRTRAPIAKKFPSMPDISKIDNMKYDQNTSDEPTTSNISTNLLRHKSCFIAGTKSSTILFDQTIKSNENYSKLYNLCSDVVSKLCFKGQTIRRKRGRPRKKIYKSLTKDLLNSSEFSLKADIQKLNEMYYTSKHRFHGLNMRNANPRRSKRFALLSIEPVLSETKSILNRNRDRSPPISSFHSNRTPLKTYSRANMIQPRMTTTQHDNKQHIQLLNIEPLSSRSQIDLQENIGEEVTQSTEYIIDTGFSNDNIYESDAVYIEYLDDNDEIESPAYEPHVAVPEPDTKTSLIITGEADTTVGSCSTHQQINWNRKQFAAPARSYKKQKQNIDIKYFEASQNDAHSTTDSMFELFTIIDEGKPQCEESTSPQKKQGVNISPVRKSTRKRKIPSEFPNFAKKVRG